MAKDDDFTGALVVLGAAAGVVYGASKLFGAFSKKSVARSAQRAEANRQWELQRAAEEEDAQNRAAWAAHHATMRPVIEAAKAAGVDVCEVCSTVNPDRCKYEGHHCNAYCSCSCASDDAAEAAERHRVQDDSD